jgi:hypothetical protein
VGRQRRVARYLNATSDFGGMAGLQDLRDATIVLQGCAICTAQAFIGTYDVIGPDCLRKIPINLGAK